MPIYEYHCQDCDRSFETLARPGNAGDAECPLCHGVNLSREMSVFAAGNLSRAGGAADPGAATMRGGGCCGGGCGCS